jgi:membrane protease YdiL (CAAX protease family)
LGEKEKYVAAALFVLTSLAFPTLYRVENASKPDDKEQPFLLRSAQLELKLDATVDSLQGEVVPPAEGEGPLRLFSPETWLSLTSEMEAESQRRFLNALAVACTAVGRDEDAAILVEKGKLTADEQEPFAFVLNGSVFPGDERMERDSQTSMLDGWVTGLLRSRYGAQGSTIAPLPEGTLQTALAGFAGAVGGFGLVLALLFFVGIGLWVFSPRILAGFRAEGDFLSLTRFGAPPVYTYLLFATWFVLWNFLGFFLSALLADEISPSGLITANLLASGAVGVILVRYRGMVRNSSLVSAVDLDRGCLTGSAVKLGVLAYIAAIPLVLLLSLVSGVLLGGGGGGVNPAIPILVGADSPLESWLLGINVVVLAPLFEEFFFRGFLFQQFRRSLGAANGIMLSALVFAAVHLSMESFIPLFGLGIILAVVYHYTRSLWASIITHALWNLGTVAAIVTLYG